MINHKLLVRALLVVMSLLSFQVWANTGVIVSGSGYVCGLTTSGEIVCWGDSATTPPTGTFTQISAYRNNACGLKTNGSIVCWGSNDSGEAIPPLDTFTWVSTGYGFSCGIKQANGRVLCWGSYYGIPPAETFTQIASGSEHACGLTTTKNIKCWGYNSNGEVSNAPVGQFTQLSSFYRGTCAVKSDQTVVCWGRSNPSWLKSLTNVAQISYSTCVLRTDGSVWCEGNQVSGQFTYVEAIGSGQCALESSGALNCTGTASDNTVPAPSGYTFKQPGGVVVTPPSTCTQAELDAKYNTGYQAGLAAGGGGSTSSAIKLTNISTRALINGGAYNVVAGFVITGAGSQKVLIRAWGLDAGVNTSLTLQTYPEGTTIGYNNDWQSNPSVGQIPASMTLPNTTDSAIIMTLQAGAYTAIMGTTGSKGLGLILKTPEKIEPKNKIMLFSMLSHFGTLVLLKSQCTTTITSQRT